MWKDEEQQGSKGTSAVCAIMLEGYLLLLLLYVCFQLMHMNVFCLQYLHNLLDVVTTYSSLIWGCAHPPILNLVPSEEITTNILFSQFTGKVFQMVKYHRLELLSGHSGKCILLNCCPIPRSLGQHPPVFALAWPVGADCEEVLCSYIVVSRRRGTIQR